jgi:hypothetical protein
MISHICAVVGIVAAGIFFGVFVVNTIISYTVSCLFKACWIIV